MGVEGRERPLGVVIISVVEIAVGSLLIVSGLAMLLLRELIKTLLTNVNWSAIDATMLAAIDPLIIFLAASSTTMGAVLVLLGVFLWKGAEFSRLTHLALGAILIFTSLVQLFILGRYPVLVLTLIGLILLAYMTRPRVKLFFD